MSDTPTTSPSPLPPEAPRPAGKWRRRFKWMGALSLVGLVLLGAFAAGSEYYTAQPEFCGSCHIMDPYYASWQKDAHAGEKGHAACVDCHYAPGEQHTVMAKFRGLSQLASYFSGRAGAGRPRARVNDASCMTSGCHGDGKFMDTEIRLGTVTFVHARHLDPKGKIAVDNERLATEVRTRLSAALGPARLQQVEKIARAMQPAQERNTALAAWLEGESLTPHQEDVIAYGELLHTEVRLNHLAGLKCSSCHQFNSTLSSHFRAEMTTCYTCHFLNQPFNANSGRCLACHEPPTGDVPVHAAQVSATPHAATSPAVTMNHSLILANNVNCIGCHSDLIHGSGKVTVRDCQNCHDQDRYLRDFSQLTTEVVTEYHRVHAAGQRARCNDCHQLIDHRLKPLGDFSEAVTLLTPVRQDCQHCHPDHHREQVELLLGRGGFVDQHAATPNPMTGSRANCQACHVKSGQDPKQEAVITGTLESCRGCHGGEYEKLFAQWQQTLGSRLKEAQDLLTTTEQRFAAATQPGDLNLAEARKLLDRAKHNVRLVSTANGIHNKNYAVMLLDQAIADLEAVGKKLAR